MVKHYAGLENIVLCLHLTKLIMNHDGVTFYVNLRPDGNLFWKRDTARYARDTVMNHKLQPYSAEVQYMLLII